MQVYFNGKVSHYKDAFPNTSFPASGPTDDFLAGLGAVKVSMFRDHDRNTQKLVPCEPVIENGFAYVVAVADKTEAEIAADVASKAAQIRATRDIKLANSDWTQAADAPVDKSAWANYRQALRDLPQQVGFPWDIVWPTQPE